LYLRGRPCGDGRLLNEHEPVVGVSRNLPNRALDGDQIRFTARSSGRSDTDEHRRGSGNRLGGLNGERQAAIGNVPVEELLEAGFVERDDAVPKRVHSLLVGIRGYNLVADLC
jgi:hypothetical protein